MSRASSEPFAVTWRRALRDCLTLEPSVKLTAFVLSTYWQADGSCPPWGGVDAPGAGPAIRTLVAQTGLGESTVRRYIGVLEREGWITRTFSGRGRGNSARWIARLPDGVSAPTKVGGRFDDLDG